MKIGIIADNPTVNSSYGEMAKWMGYHLADTHDVFYIGLQHRGAPVIVPIREKLLRMHSGTVIYNGVPYMINKAVEAEKPDILITIRDIVTFSTQGFSNAFTLSQYKGKVKLVSYVPMMEPRLLPFIKQAVMDNSDHILTFTEYMKQKLIGDGFPYNIVDTLNIGYEDSIYHKTEPMITAGNNRIFGFVGLLADKRKSLGSLMTAFSHYVKSDPESYLYIHNNPSVSPLNQYNIIQLAQSMGIQGHLLMPKHNNAFDWHPEYYYTEEQMASLFSSFTATVSMSAQEGYNMPFLESMACGVPALGVRMPFYDWSDQIMQAPSHEFELHTGFGYSSDPVEFAEYMHKAVKHKVDVKKLDHLKWVNVVAKLNKILEGL